MSSLKQLEQLVREDRVAEGDRLRRNAQIASHVFATSPYLSAANFTKLHPDDLLLLYELYDENYFHGLLGKSLDAENFVSAFPADDNGRWKNDALARSRSGLRGAFRNCGLNDTDVSVVSGS